MCFLSEETFRIAEKHKKDLKLFSDDYFFRDNNFFVVIGLDMIKGCGTCSAIYKLFEKKCSHADFIEFKCPECHRKLNIICWWDWIGLPIKIRIVSGLIPKEQLKIIQQGDVRG